MKNIYLLPIVIFGALFASEDNSFYQKDMTESALSATFRQFLIKFSDLRPLLTKGKQVLVLHGPANEHGLPPSQMNLECKENLLVEIESVGYSSWAGYNGELGELFNPSNEKNDKRYYKMHDEYTRCSSEETRYSSDHGNGTIQKTTCKTAILLRDFLRIAKENATDEAQEIPE